MIGYGFFVCAKVIIFFVPYTLFTPRNAHVNGISVEIFFFYTTQRINITRDIFNF